MMLASAAATFQIERDPASLRPGPVAHRNGVKPGWGTIWIRLMLAWSLWFAGSANASEDPLVIWLSLDGVRHDYPDRAEFPGLTRLAREGVRAEQLIPVFPTSTFSNHVAMATCARTDRHGIVANRFIDPERGEFSYENDASWMLAEPIWASAARQGVRSAVFFWVGSGSAWQGNAATYRKHPFDEEIPESVKVDQILAWIDLPSDERPALILSYWRGTDRVGHIKGPDHSDVTEQLALQDEQLVRLLAGLDERDAWSRTTLFVASDHGMTAVRREIDVPGALDEAGVDARVRADAAVSFVYLEDLGQLELAEAALREIPGHTVYRASDLPAELRLARETRTGDLVLLADPPSYYVHPGRFEAIAQRLMRGIGWKTGAHGFSQALPDMAGIFFAMGRGVSGDFALGSVSNLDIAPTISKLLGMNPPAHCEGSALSGIGGEAR
jgi:predicted AlkP superfamily pyrophosphatase or phosphodiesterase